MTTDQAFLQKIIANPAADEPRLIYADWLDEQGQEERAEFIRVQIELAKRPRVELRPEVASHPLFQAVQKVCEEAFGADYVALRRREWELLNSRCVDRGPTPWLSADMSFTPAADGMAARQGWKILPVALFRRGFVAEVTLTCAEWMKHGPQLVTAAPLEEVRLSDRDPRPRPNVPNAVVWTLAGVTETEIATDPLECLPLPLWTRLRLGQRMVLSLFYDDPETALRDVSDACLAWARNANTLTLSQAINIGEPY